MIATREGLNVIVGRLDDIETDQSGMCRWADVATAAERMKAEVLRLSASPQPGYAAGAAWMREEAAQAASRSAEAELKIFDAANRDKALSVDGCIAIQDRALARDSICRDLIEAIRALPLPEEPSVEPVANLYRGKIGGTDKWSTWTTGNLDPYYRETESLAVYAHPPAPGVSVKPLEWVDTGQRGFLQCHHYAVSGSLRHTVHPVDTEDGGFYEHYGIEYRTDDPLPWKLAYWVGNNGLSGVNKSFATIEAAKAAAQADYDQRIMSAIEVSHVE